MYHFLFLEYLLHITAIYQIHYFRIFGYHHLVIKSIFGLYNIPIQRLDHG